MAQLTLGIGTSHSPMLSIAPAHWQAWSARDARRDDLSDIDGRTLAYRALLEQAPPGIAEELDPERLEAKARRCREALDCLRDTITDARIDAMVLIGDDQSEHLHPDNLPAVLLYHGATIRNTRAEVPANAPVEDRERILGYYEPHRDVDYPVARELAEHLIDYLLDEHFDVASSSELPRPRAEGHALQFPHRRLLAPDLPIVPVLLNTYVPPTQPRAARCYDLGVALGAGIRQFGRADGDGPRIGVLASGGLSHFVVWEEFDRALLAALEAGDEDHLRTLPERLLRSGTSEVKCWIAAAGACRGLSFRTIDYVPGYRSPAGTGVGLAFGAWR